MSKRDEWCRACGHAEHDGKRCGARISRADHPYEGCTCTADKDGKRVQWAAIVEPLNEKDFGPRAEDYPV